MAKYPKEFRFSNFFILSLAATCQFTFAQPSEKPADQQTAGHLHDSIIRQTEW
jgi:hypothetical protein